MNLSQNYEQGYSFGFTIIDLSFHFSHLAIKTGRYTLEKRTKNIEEVKKLISKQKREEKIAHDALLFDPELRARQLEHIIEQVGSKQLEHL